MKTYFYKINKKTGNEFGGEIEINAGLMARASWKDTAICKYILNLYRFYFKVMTSARRSAWIGLSLIISTCSERQ